MKVSSDDVFSLMIFKIDDISYAINVNYVVMVLETPEIIKIPDMPEYIAGYIQTNNLFSPIIKGKLNTNLSTFEFSHYPHILILYSDWNKPISHIGIMVSDFSDVTTINKNEVKAFPSLGNIYKPFFIEGVIEINKRLILLINNIFILTDAEKVMIKNIFDNIVKN